MKMKLPMVIVFFGLILELVEFNETYKIKPYSYYSPPPWRRPRWHSFPKHRKRYHPKRILAHKYHHYEPNHHRYAPYHEDSIDTSDQDNNPFVIVIQLPHKNEKKKYDFYQRKHVIDSPQNNDYDDDDNDEVKVYKLK